MGNNFITFVISAVMKPPFIGLIVLIVLLNCLKFYFRISSRKKFWQGRPTLHYDSPRTTDSSFDGNQEDDGPRPNLDALFRYDEMGPAGAFSGYDEIGGMGVNSTLHDSFGSSGSFGDSGASSYSRSLHD